MCERKQLIKRLLRPKSRIRGPVSMKRLAYSAVACALLALTSSSLAIAKKDKDKNQEEKNKTVLMCYKQPGGHPYEIYVKEKDVYSHLAQGDTLGGCPVISPVPEFLPF